MDSKGVDSSQLMYCSEKAWWQFLLLFPSAWTPRLLALTSLEHACGFRWKLNNSLFELNQQALYQIVIHGMRSVSITVVIIPAKIRRRITQRRVNPEKKDFVYSSFSVMWDPSGKSCVENSLEITSRNHKSCTTIRKKCLSSVTYCNKSFPSQYNSFNGNSTTRAGNVLIMLPATSNTFSLPHWHKEDGSSSILYGCKWTGFRIQPSFDD